MHCSDKCKFISDTPVPPAELRQGGATEITLLKFCEVCASPDRPHQSLQEVAERWKALPVVNKGPRVLTLDDLVVSVGEEKVDESEEDDEVMVVG